MSDKARTPGRTDNRHTAAAPAPAEIESADSLRHAIDRGRGADKVDFPDPAAAPLGTDDEAAGTSPTPARVRLAAAHELRQPALGRSTNARRSWLWAAIITALLVGFALGLVWLRR